MRKLFNKIKNTDEHNHAGNPSHHQSEIDDAPLEKSVSVEKRDVYRYRRIRSVNLGSWFVLEPWISESPFKHSAPPKQSDLDVSRGANAKTTLDNHWDTWITDGDWDWIARIGINSVRIPIGYYHLCGADKDVLLATDFEKYQDVYEGAWARIVNACKKAESLDIGVLIDLHAAPGAQNPLSHSGTSKSHSEFFSHARNQKHTIFILKTLLISLRTQKLSNIIGIELLNEPDPPSDEALIEWYKESIKALRTVDPEIPIYLGECWRTDVYLDGIEKHPPQGMTVLDHHLYRCFTEQDIHTGVADLTRSIEDSNGISSILSRASERMGRIGGGIVIGEWSGALNPVSLAGTVDVKGAQQIYVEAQLRIFDASCAGWFFWTYKKEKTGDTGWSLSDSIEAGVFPQSVGLQRRRGDDSEANRRDERNNAKDDALATHVHFWSQYPSVYDHSLFERGFLVGWDDAFTFISMPSSHPIVSGIGFTGAWSRKRAMELNVDVKGKHYWEFEHGLKQGSSSALHQYRSSM